MREEKFVLDGKPLSTRTIPQQVIRIKQILDRLPNNELLTTRDLGRRSGYSVETISSRMGAHSELKAYLVTVRYPNRQNVWGNPRTIAKLRKHKEIL